MHSDRVSGRGRRHKSSAIEKRGALAQAAIALEGSERQYRATIDSLEEAIHVVDDKLRLVLLNKTFDLWCDRLGIARGHVGQFLFHLFPFLSARVRAEYRRVFRTGRSVSTEEATVVGGEVLTTETHKLPLTDHGTVHRVITVVRDITKRKQMEESLRRSEQAYKALADNAPDLVVRFDKGLRHLYVNPVVEGISGISPRDFLGKTNRELGMPRKLESFWTRAFHQVFRTGRGRTIEFEYPTPKGPRTYQSRIAPELGADGAVEHLVCITRDITEQKRAERALREAHENLEREVRARTADLRAMAAEVVRAEEQERERIGQILHEDRQ